MQPYQISAFHIRSGFLTKIHHTSWDSRASKFKKKKKDVKEPAGCDDDDMYLKGKKKCYCKCQLSTNLTSVSLTCRGITVKSVRITVH